MKHPARGNPYERGIFHTLRTTTTDGLTTEQLADDVRQHVDPYLASHAYNYSWRRFVLALDANLRAGAITWNPHRGHWQVNPDAVIAYLEAREAEYAQRHPETTL